MNKKELEFKKIKTKINDVFVINRNRFKDHRGTLNKLFNEDLLKKIYINFKIKECIFSESKKNVLRGMHYQKDPYAQSKIVTVLEGKILDVILGIKKNKIYNNRGKIYSTILSSKNNRSILIPEGYAHGYLTLSKKAKVCYMASNIYKKQNDMGIHYNSFGFKWPVKKPILSKKDRQLKTFVK